MVLCQGCLELVGLDPGHSTLENEGLLEAPTVLGVQASLMLKMRLWRRPSFLLVGIHVSLS